jgi:phosphonate transport system ATP-binding protein
MLADSVAVPFGEPAPASPMLEVRDLCKRYPNGTQALDGVSLKANPGEVTVVLGPNGSGKSTLVRCVVRLTEATSGSVVVAGNDLTRLSGVRLRAARRRMGVIFQSASLVARRSSLANVACGCLGRNHGLLTACGLLPKSELERALPYLERVGMRAVADQRVDTLSGGQAQRVAVARALFQDPVILFADEPVASLDPDAANEIMLLMAGLARNDGLAVVVVLHQLDLARRYADRIVGLRRGRVVLDAPTAQVDMNALGALYQGEAA